MALAADYPLQSARSLLSCHGAFAPLFRRRAMTIKVGDRLPPGTLSEYIDVETEGCKVGPNQFPVDALTRGKKVVIFGLPGAFTPTCSAQHVPSYVKLYDELKAKGVDDILCLSVNDAFVMGAWAKNQNAAGKVRMMGDGSAAYTKALGLELDLTAAKPPVLQGEKGLSRKGSGEGEYSHYVSISRLSAAGALVENGRRTPLSGSAWFDHEWGPGALPEGAAGWDWFALQLDDGSELMLYRIRTKDGRATPFSSGVFVPPTGPTVPLRFDEVRFRSTREWRSPRSGGVYPAGWEITIPRLALELTVEPLVADQELVTGRSTGVTYWEGACRAAGRRGGRIVAGKGYAELTGYSGRDVPGFTGR